MDLYAENIIEHSKNPHNRGRLENPDLVVKEDNPLCGDEILLEMKLKDGKVFEIAFSGNGCAISQAAASMLTDELKGKTLKEAGLITKDEMVKMVGVPLSPSRVKCALLCYGALKIMLEKAK